MQFPQYRYTLAVWSPAVRDNGHSTAILSYVPDKEVQLFPASAILWDPIAIFNNRYPAMQILLHYHLLYYVCNNGKSLHSVIVHMVI